MSTANKVLIHRWFEEVWNKKRKPAIFEMLHKDALIFGLQGNESRPIRGPEEFVPFWEKFTTAIPDMNVAVESTVAEDDKVVARISVRGKHIGAGFGIPPTGNLVSSSGICLAHVKNEMVFEAWNSFDFLTLYQQLGVIPSFD